ncbi:hypothetical protein BDR22DRAFT_851912 [Usnea florida]
MDANTGGGSAVVELVDRFRPYFLSHTTPSADNPPRHRPTQRNSQSSSSRTSKGSSFAHGLSAPPLKTRMSNSPMFGCRNGICPILQLYAGACGHWVHLPYNNAREDGGRERSWVLDGGGVRRAGVVVLGDTVRIVPLFVPLSSRTSIGVFFFFLFSILCTNNQR